MGVTRCAVMFQAIQAVILCDIAGILIKQRLNKEKTKSAHLCRQRGDVVR